MNKKQFIDDSLARLTEYWFFKVYSLGAMLFLALGLLDYISTPENFSRFLLYRICVAAALLTASVLVKKVKRPLQTALFFFVVTASAVTVELMILQFGGYRSTYYVGLILLSICVLGLIPVRVIHAIFSIVIIYSIYLIPLLAFEKEIDFRLFFTPNAFMISVFATTVVWRYFHQKSLVNEFGLQYDLEQQKKQLEVYSLQLKAMVEERTKELRESEQWHRSLVDNATDGIVVMDKNGIVLNINSRACEMHEFSRDVLLGTHIRLLEGESNPDQIAGRIRRLLAGEALVYETKHYKKDGTPLFLEISSKAITIGEGTFIQSFYRDITEKKKMQEHILQTQKMESVGLLAGGIAHDFNNILTAILGHSEIIRMSVTDDKAVRSLTVIEDASRRAGRMISKLLGFARKTNYEVVPLNMNDVIFDTVKLLERMIDRNIDLTVELDNCLPLVRGDLNNLEQIIMNLIVNARDAMPSGGRIIVRTMLRDVERGMPDIPHYVRPGSYVLLTVTDTGIGMTRETADRIFEPFFTTKEPGKGTGLGLSMVYGAVKEHNGYISIQSEPGKGSCFTIYLPVSEAMEATRALAPKIPVGGNETVLVVDDEEDILSFINETLSRQGYKVICLSDPVAAVAAFGEISRNVDLVITDIVMPGINGKEFITRIKSIKPKVKILAISGYTRYVAPRDEVEEINGFVQKPFEAYYLLMIVRRILDAHQRDIHPMNHVNLPS